MDDDKILNFLKTTGPTVPTKVAKNMNQEILLTSAQLSNLVTRKKVKISQLKIGGSPLYYLPGQEDQLFPFAAGNVNPKDYVVLEDLKEQQILREADLELIGKVALRNLKDFAVPLEVGFKGEVELFWKWHLLNEEETNQKINEILLPKEALQTTLAEDVEVEETSAAQLAPEMLEDPKIEEASKGSKPEGASKPEKEVVKQEEVAAKTGPTQNGTTINAEGLLGLLEGFFKVLDITVEQKETIRKNKEINLTLKVPSAVGIMTYFCKAKDKKRCDEKDLSAAYMEAQMKKLPLLFLFTGEMNKKSQEMLDSGAFDNVLVKKVE